MQDETYFGKGSLDKPKDFLKPTSLQHFEIAGAMQPAVWVEKDPVTGFITYPKRNQGVKSDCVCYAAAKALAIDELQENGNWRELSPDSVYPYIVQPGGGSSSVDAAAFIVDKGMTLDALYPSDALTEAQAEISTNIGTDAKIIGGVYKPSQIVECATDFETIAQILQFYQSQGIKKGVLITVVGQNNGTWLSTTPTAPNTTNGVGLWYHRMIVTDFGLIQGNKVLAADNSWGTVPGNAGQQFFTEDYAPYIYGGQYTLNEPDLSTVNPLPKPNYQWSVQLQVGSSGPDVVALQKALQSVGMFPISSIVSPTGYFGGLTQLGLKEFQSSFGVPVTGIVDEATMTLLNSIFKV